MIMSFYSCYDLVCTFCFFFNDTATTEIYTLSLHDALPISLLALAVPPAPQARGQQELPRGKPEDVGVSSERLRRIDDRSEEHTSELQSRQYLVCRLLLEKKKKKKRCKDDKDISSIQV